ncbi:MAG TPA: DUF192 domain-containing protein [Acidobacteriota bacterium]|nr:DUF192 domain-containing protein [Acidobacteriota bacterium]
MRAIAGNQVAAAVMGLTFLAAGLQAFCRAPEKDRFVKVFFPDGGSIMAELAVTDAERARGLMFRERIQPDQGMLFVFEEEGLHSFWMKNTLVPLDILWLGRDRRIVHIAADVPPCKADPCPAYGPDIPASFVLELKAGEARARGLRLEDRLEFVL